MNKEKDNINTNNLNFPNNNDVPFKMEEIRNLLENGNQEVYQRKYRFLFKNYRRIFMITIPSVLILMTFFSINIFNSSNELSEKESKKHNSTFTGKNEIKQNSQENEIAIASENIDRKAKDMPDKSGKEEETDTPESTTYSLPLNKYNKVVWDSIDSWNKIEFDPVRKEPFYSSKWIYMSEPKNSSENPQSINYFEPIAFEKVLYFYKVLYNELSNAGVPNLDLIGYEKNEINHRKLSQECLTKIELHNGNDSLKEKFIKFSLISSGIHSNMSRINELELTKKELEKLNINYMDSSVVFYSEAYFNEIPKGQMRDSDLKKYEKCSYPMLVKYRNENFWLINPQGKGVGMMEGYNPRENPQSMNDAWLRENKLAVLKTSQVLEYSGWRNSDFCKLCPILSDNFNHFYQFSPLTFNHPVFNELYEKSIKENKLLNEAQNISDKNQRDSLYTKVFQLEKSNILIEKRLMMNYLIPVKIKMPYYENDTSKLFTTVTNWYIPNEEFLQAIPERYSIIIRKELDAIYKIESGLLEPEQACKGLSLEDTFFELCKIASDNIKLVDVYPNPITNEANLKFLLLEDRYLCISIHDQNGNFVKNILDWDKLKNGEHNIQINLNSMTSGTYTISIITDKSEKVVKRVIKL